MDYRRATPADAATLAELNQLLIRDEAHRNRMTLPELVERMAGWLRGEYEAVLLEDAGFPVGYALFCRGPEYVYLRQFYVRPERRRRGVGRDAVKWLRQHAWAGAARIRLDVLIENTAAMAFWRAVGFRDYCLTMEFEAGAPVQER
jgi:GNAT superfamily N-acetyltransferase